MAYTNVEGRQQLLDELAAAAEQIGVALAALGSAYEQLDEHAGDRLEEALFRPVQAALGRAKRTHAEFSARHAMPAGAIAAGVAPRAAGAQRAIDRAVAAVQAADAALASLQDSMLPVEIGDAPLRAELAEVRELLGEVPARARALSRTLGR